MPVMQRLARNALLSSQLLSSLAACTKMDTDPDVDVEKVITISTNTVPDFIAVRDDADGRWLAPTLIGPNTFTFVATGAYRVTVACDGADRRVELFQIARTLDDDTTVDVRCDSSDTTELTTTMVQAGTVSVGDYSVASSEPNWDVVLEANPGRHTIAAHDDARMLILRDVEVTVEGSTIPQLDLDAGFGLIAGELTTDALFDESVRAQVLLELGDTIVSVHDGDPSTARFVPASELVGSEHQYIHVSAHRIASSRFVSSKRTGSQRLTLPAPMTGTFAVVGSDLTATWKTSLSGSVAVRWQAFSPFESKLWDYQLTASESYASALGETTTLEVESITDLPPTLAFDSATTQQNQSVSITDDLGDGETVGVEVRASVN